MHTSKFFGIAFLLFILSTPAWAKTTIQSHGRYVYFKTPYQDLIAPERHYLLEETIRLTTTALQSEIPSGKYQVEVIDTLSKVSTNLDLLLGKIEDYLESSHDPQGGVRATSLIPTAFTIYFGGGTTAAWGFGGGGDVSLALVFLPVKVYRLDKVTKDVDQYYELQTAWIGLPQIKMGAGAGGGVKLGGGVGFIWGPLDKPSDYVGPFFSLEKILIAKFGISIKTGVLHQPKRLGTLHNLFLAAGIVSGPSLTAGVFAGASWVIDAGQLLGALGISNNPIPASAPVPNEFEDSGQQLENVIRQFRESGGARGPQ